jgi:hypothetical protein
MGECHGLPGVIIHQVRHISLREKTSAGLRRFGVRKKDGGLENAAAVLAGKESYWKIYGMYRADLCVPVAYRQD